MRLPVALICLAAASMAPGAEVPPGRQHRLTMQGETVVTFVPQAKLPAIRAEYKAIVEYVVDTRRLKPARAAEGAKGKGPPARAAVGAVDIALHSTEVAHRRGDEPAVMAKVSRSRFQGRLQANGPTVDVAAKQAPAAIMDVLKRYDVVAATMLVDDRNKVVDLRIKADGAQRALVETLVSIHAPVPEGLDAWEAPSRLAMGQGQTARGTLRCTRLGGSGPSRVKVEGVLKGEGVVAGNLIKDGTYTVEGEQTYDPKAREWVAARWTVRVDNELADAAGQTVARARGTMVVESAVAGARPAEGPATTRR